MKKWIILILMCIVVKAADRVNVIDKTGRHVNPGATNRWPVSHLNANTAGVKMLRSAPGNTRSHYVTGFIMTGGAAGDGFHFLRQNALLLNRNEEALSMADHSTDFDWGTSAADGDFTAEFWINLTATTTAVPSLMLRGDESSDGWLIELTTASLVKFSFHDGTGSTIIVTGETAIDDGDWHHILVQVDRDSTTGMQIYVDGETDGDANDPTGNSADVNGGSTIVMTGVDIHRYTTVARSAGKKWIEKMSPVPRK